MEERLTKKDKNGRIYINDQFSGSPYIDAKETLTRLCKYEDAEEDGRLILLPCKVGDIVFGCFKGQIFSEVVTAFRFDLDGLIIETDDDEYSADVFGAKLFLTREGAEKRLEELKGEIK